MTERVLAGADTPAAERPIAVASAGEFRALFEAESSFVWNLLRRLGVPPRDLEDVAHDVFLTVYRRLDDYDRSRPLRPWLFGIAFRVASRYRDLARHRHEITGDAEDPTDHAPRADDQLIARESRALLERALDTLDLDRRAVFVLHDIEGQAMPDIAAALALPLNTAYSRLRLARAEVKAAVQRTLAHKGAA